MNRVELLDCLARIAPALSNNNLVPVLSHYWFSKQFVMAYNDKIAIKTKLISNFAGAIPDTFVSLLSVSRAKEVQLFTEEDDTGKKIPEGQLLIKAASSKLKLPFLPEQSTKIFEMPKSDVSKSLPVDMKAFLEALQSCTKSLKEDTSMPDSLGITLVFKDKELNLYATNDSTISFASVKLKQETKEARVVISGDFCRQMLALAKFDGIKHFEINSDYSLFECGDNVLFGKLIDVQRPLDFDSVISSSFPEALRKQLVSVPTKLELILDRAVIITESKTERSKTAITVKDGIAKFFSKSEKGEVRDSVQLEDVHPDVDVSIDPRLFKAGYGAYDKLIITEQCLIMAKGTSLYLVSASA